MPPDFLPAVLIIAIVEQPLFCLSSVDSYWSFVYQGFQFGAGHDVLAEFPTHAKRLS